MPLGIGMAKSRAPLLHGSDARCMTGADQAVNTFRLLRQAYLPALVPSPPADLGAATYTSTLSNVFTINTTRLTQRQAQAVCSSQGAQLASFESRDEQVEVEQYFSQNGYLLPSFHKTYWLGLTAVTWPIYSWSDRSLAVAYTNWGNQQPNRSPSPGLCAYANFTMSMGSPPAWGWDDTDCETSTSVFICKRASTKGSYYSSRRHGATYIFNSSLANFTQAEGFCRDKGAHLVSFSSQAEQVGGKCCVAAGLTREGREREARLCCSMLLAPARQGGALAPCGDAACLLHAPWHPLPHHFCTGYIGMLRVSLRVQPCSTQAEVEAYYTNSGFMFPAFHKFYWMGLHAARSMAFRDMMAPAAQSRWPNFTYLDGSPAPGRGVFAHWGRYQPLNFPEPDNRFAPELCAGGNASEAFGNPKAWGWADTRCNGSFPFMCKMAGKPCRGVMAPKKVHAA
jgi:hypothetical protein